MERVDAAAAPPPGYHRDGSLLVPDALINGAKELGLGGATGMYDHVKGLVRVGAADVPHGTSMETETPGGRPSGGVGGRHGARASTPPRVDVRNTDAAVAAIRTTVTTVGRGRVAGFGAGGAVSRVAAAHLHAEAFQRRKGVVNTIGGAKDVTRHSGAPAAVAAPTGGTVAGGAPPAAATRAASQPPRVRGAPRIATFATFDTTGEEGSARRAARDRRDAARARAGKSAADGVHVIPPKKAAPSASRLVTSADAGARRGGGGGGGGGARTASAVAAPAHTATRTTAPPTSARAASGGAGSARSGTAASAAAAPPSRATTTTRLPVRDAVPVRGTPAGLAGGGSALVDDDVTVARPRATGSAGPSAAEGGAAAARTAPSLHHAAGNAAPAADGRAALAAARAAFFDKRFKEDEARKAEVRAAAFMKGGTST